MMMMSLLMMILWRRAKHIVILMLLNCAFCHSQIEAIDHLICDAHFLIIFGGWLALSMLMFLFLTC